MSLTDDRFLFLIDMGFDEEEINNQLSVWNDSILDYAADENMRHVYIKILNMFKNIESVDNEIALILFFSYIECFSVPEDEFTSYISLLKRDLGNDFIEVLWDEYIESGGCKTFDLFSSGGFTDEEWNETIHEINKNRFLDLKEPRGYKVDVKYSTDLLVNLHDRGALCFNDAASKSYELFYSCVKLAYWFDENKALYYPGVVASAYWYMGVLLARKKEYLKAKVCVTESLKRYLQLASESNSNGFTTNIEECRNMINSLNEVM